MKRLVLSLIIAFPFMINAQSILPDLTWHDDASASHSKWYTAQFGSTAFNYDGMMYAFNYTDNGYTFGANTYVFTINRNNIYALTPYKLGSSRSNKLVFGYLGENGSCNPGVIIGKTFAFVFNNRMWYFQHVHNAHIELNVNYDKDESYECFALFPLDTMQSCITYYETHDPPPDITKLGAFQLDSYLYFIGTKPINDDGYYSWYFQEYSLNSSNNHFSHIRDMEIGGVVPTTHDMLSGILKRLDRDGNEYVVFSTYKRGGMGQNDSKIFKLEPYVSNGVTEFTCTYFLEDNQKFNSAMALVGGTIKGNRTSDPNQYYTDRFTSFSICENKNSDGIHPIYTWEIGVDDCQGECPLFTKPLYNNNVTIPLSTAPSPGAGDYFQMVGTYELVPKVYTQAFGGTTDGYQKNVWIFYPDANYHWNGVMFTSDRWRLTNDSIVVSTDLYNKELYPGIDSLWSLIGICDGGPPISVDWEVWEDHHTPGTEPTELNFTVVSEHETELTSTYEDQWSIGQNFEITAHIKELEANFSEEFNYSTTYKNVVSHSTEIEKKLSLPFALMESNQDTAVLVWAIPSIIRYPFSSYPWWDTDQTNPVPYTFQYMFRTTGITIYEENVGIDEYPFNIQEPNAPDMDDWKETSRPEIDYAILNQGAVPIINATWSNNQIGQPFTYSITENSTESYEQSSSYEVSANSGIELPKVFKIGASASHEIHYSTESTITNNFGNEIECDFSNLRTNTVGPNVSSLNLSVYWFRNVSGSNGVSPNWWYWSAYGDQRPWYIAYINNNTRESIKLLSPANGNVESKTALYFAWIADSEGVDEYTVVIANSNYIYNGTIIYQQSVGTSNQTTLPEFQAEKGKTYYWAVKGMTSKGLPVWSDIRSFTIKEEQENDSPALMALVYPNPSVNNKLHIAINPVAEGDISIFLTDLFGKTITDKQVKNIDGSSMDILFSIPDLPAGIYLALIRTDREQVVKKVVVR